MYLYAKPTPGQVEINCGAKHFIVTLENVGIIELLDDCNLKDDSLILSSHKDKYFDVNLHYKNVTLNLSDLKTGKNNLITITQPQDLIAS